MTHSRVQRVHKRRPSRKHKKAARKLAMDVLLNLWLHIRILIDYVIDLLFGLYYNGTEIKIPPVSKKFLLESATSLAASIRDKKLKSEEVVEAYIDRIKEVNGILNAVTDQRFEAALEEARQIDRDIADGKINESIFKKKPFLGVPFTSKESTACAGLLHTFGIVSRKDIRATEDADVIALMKEAGGILLGNTNIPELNLWQETRNMIFGQTLNPYNTTRTTGGSSGGEAAIIAACGSAFGIGTDIGGSIRMPAYFCGIYGHKPTSYLISTKGLTRRTGKEKPTMVVAGPMSRYAEDLAPLLKILVAENVNKLKLDAPVDVRALRYFYIEESGDTRVSSVCVELRHLMRKVVNYITEDMAEEGQNVSCLDIPELEHSSRLWRFWMTQEPTKFQHELANREGEVSLWPELFKKLTGQSQFTLASIYQLINQKLPKENEPWARETTAQLKEKLLNELESNGVLLYPSYTWPASYHYSAFLRPYNFSYWSIWNVLQFPVTQVPLGLSKDGLPIGLQIVAAPYNDHLTIAVARHLEKAIAGYVPPFQH